jgi:hypothetical protein
MILRQIWVAIVAVLALWVSTGSAWGSSAGTDGVPADATPSIAGGDSQPHEGIYLGVRLGLGHLQASFDGPTIWGQSYSVGAWAGISLTPNLVLMAEFYNAHIFTPSSGYMTWMKRFNLLGAGPGLKYYLTPDNVYLTGSVMLSRITFESGSYYDYWSSPDQASHWGGTGRLAIGKEWQTSPSWRLGL